MKSVVLITLLIFAISPSLCQTLQFSGWQMCDPIGGNVVYHNGFTDDQQLFAFCPEPDGNWIPAPNPITVGFDDNSGIFSPNTVAYFKWFRTKLFIPYVITGHDIEISLTRDDAVNLYVNDAFPQKIIGLPYHNETSNVIAGLHTGLNDIKALLVDTYSIGYFKEVYLQDTITRQRAEFNPSVPEPSGLLILGSTIFGLLKLKRRAL